MKRYSVCVIGGGAAGMASAITAKRRGISVVICEKMPCLGKKILASGNGRCNLLNDDLLPERYNEASRALVSSVFSRFGKKEILIFFKELGLETYSDNGRIFPVTNQSASVLKVIEMELKRLVVAVELNFDVADIAADRDGFTLVSKEGKKLSCDRLIITAGGKTYPALGSDGSSYKLAKIFGHHLIEPVPSAVPLVVKDPLCHILQGQKIFAKTKSIIAGETMKEVSGDLLFTKYGLSGTSILDISDDISVAINRKKKDDVAISADMVPFMDKEALERKLLERIKRQFQDEDLLAGILPNKFGTALKDILKCRKPDAIVKELKDRRFKVIGTRGWNEAEFTSGGIDVNEVRTETLESKIKRGLYFAGEALDVNGGRGGYNLAWAWASGFVAGHTS